MESQFKTFAEDFARKAGMIMKEKFTLGMAKQWKSDNTPLTEADTEINSLLISEVKSHFPSHDVRGEEESSSHNRGEYVWVCDPVDGTIPFSHGIPISSFSLALTKNGESILGVVCDPFQDRLYSAAKGVGASLNGKPIKVSASASFKGTAGSYEDFERARYDVTGLTNHLTKEGVKLMRLCSFVYPSALVAAGELAFTIFPHTTAHDAAAIKIIVEEAGGKCTDLFGGEQRYDADINGFIASNGHIHESLISLTKELVRVKNKI